MAHDYNTSNLRINTNFLDDTLSGNLYEWNKICVIQHHDIHNKEIYDIISKRCERFNKIIEDHSYKTCLFHITRILTISDIQEYMNNMIQLKQLYSINTYVVVVVCCDNLDNVQYFKENFLFIIKRVEPYDLQITQGDKSDNNFYYANEINIMKQYFNFQLVPLNEI